jgi:hypothetical protein
MREVASFHPAFWFGRNLKEVIINFEGKFALLENESNECTGLGGNLEEAKDKLKQLNKDGNFPDFINQ